MDDELKRVRGRVENDIGRTFYASAEEGEKVVSLEDFREGNASVEAENYMNRFMEWLRLHHPELRRAAELMAYEGVLSVPDQVLALGVPVEKVYKIRERLRSSLHQFDAAVSKVARQE